MELQIKNMVCPRCVMVVDDELRKLGLHPVEVDLGIARISEETLSPGLKKQLEARLTQLGFELLDDLKTRTIERIKNFIIRKIVHSETIDGSANWSDLLAAELHQDYGSLSSLFSSAEGITLEQYIIRQKTERVKELLFYDELSLSEISYKLGYSSVAHLSSQFKKVTGQTPSQFKSSRNPLSRKAIDSIA